jgi:hypothetical protein
MTIKPGCYRDVYDLSATPHVAHACAAGTEAPSNGHRVAWTIERPTCTAALRKSTSVNVRHRRPTLGFRPCSRNSFHLSDQPGDVRDTAALAKAVDDAGTGLGVTGDTVGRRQHLGGLMTLAAGVLAASWIGSWVVSWWRGQKYPIESGGHFCRCVYRTPSGWVAAPGMAVSALNRGVRVHFRPEAGYPPSRPRGSGYRCRWMAIRPPR